MRLLKLLAPFLIALPSLAVAQVGGTQMPKLDYFPILLLNPTVQKELHLSPAVSQKEQGYVMQMGMQMLPLAMAQKPQSPDQRKQFEQKALKAYEDLEAKTIAPLNEAQRARLRQLSLQAYGPAALSFPKVQNALGLTSAQRYKISAILTENGRAMMGHVPHGKPSDMMSQMGAIRRAQNQARASTERQVNEVLTSAQRAHWSTMQGKKLPGLSDFGGLGRMFGG